jgi:hypothetical protein
MSCFVYTRRVTAGASASEMSDSFMICGGTTAQELERLARCGEHKRSSKAARLC